MVQIWNASARTITCSRFVPRRFPCKVMLSATHFSRHYTGLRLTDLLGLIAAQIPVARETNPAVDYSASFKMKIRTASLFGLCAPVCQIAIRLVNRIDGVHHPNWG